jgi:hypothetical protein
VSHQTLSDNGDPNVGKAKNSYRVKELSGAAKRSKPATASNEELPDVDRRAARDRRKPSDRRAENVPVAVERRALQRRAKVSRRRQIDPTTCERDYTEHEVEFMAALEQYKRTSGRMFPTCSEVLEVLRGLGYQKVPTPSEPAVEVTPTSGDAIFTPLSSSELPPVISAVV